MCSLQHSLWFMVMIGLLVSSLQGGNNPFLLNFYKYWVWWNKFKAFDKITFSRATRKIELTAAIWITKMILFMKLQIMSLTLSNLVWVAKGRKAGVLCFLWALKIWGDISPSQPPFLRWGLLQGASLSWSLFCPWPLNLSKMRGEEKQEKVNKNKVNSEQSKHRTRWQTQPNRINNYIKCQHCKYPGQGLSKRLLEMPWLSAWKGLMSESVAMS